MFISSQIINLVSCTYNQERYLCSFNTYFFHTTPNTTLNTKYITQSTNIVKNTTPSKHTIYFFRNYQLILTFYLKQTKNKKYLNSVKLKTQRCHITVLVKSILKKVLYNVTYIKLFITQHQHNSGSIALYLR